jgi:DNA-binding transcriptional LysR family regulator
MSYGQFRNVTIQQLEILIVLVETGSFTRAARTMLLSQPTLTKHIKNLEDMLDSRVVERTNTGISLTPEGRILYDHARRMCKLRDEAHDKIQKIKNRVGGDIFACASNIPSTYILPRLLGKFKKLNPDIRFHIQVGDSEEALQMVLMGQAQIGLIGKETQDKKLHVEPIWKDKLVLVGPMGHELARRPSVTLDQLIKLPFISRERGSGTRETMDMYLRKYRGIGLSDFNTVCEIGSNEAVKEVVLAGVGVSILSDLAVERECLQGIMTVIPVDDFSIERKFFLIYKKQLNLMTCHQRFIDFLRLNRTVDG